MRIIIASIWIATDGGGLNCYDPRLKTFVDFPGKAVLAKYNVHGFCRKAIQSGSVHMDEDSFS